MQKGMFRKGLVLGIIVLFICMSITPSVAVDTVKKSSKPNSNDNTLYVDGSEEGDYSTIQSAINDANDGDTVFVYDDSSPYKEHISVDESINFRGENRDTTIIDGDGRGQVVFLNTPSVTISEFTIQNGYTGILVHYYSHFNTIKNNIILNNGRGISLRTSMNNKITRNKISNSHVGVL